MWVLVLMSSWLWEQPGHRHPPALLRAGAASPQAPCEVWGVTVKEGHKSIGESPKEGYGDGEGSGGEDG